MEKQRKMSVQECRDSLLLKGVECHSRYHERPDRCRYCECREELQQVGMSCHSQELLRRQWSEDVMELPMGSARLDIFTEAFLYQRELYLDYFGTEAIKQELEKDDVYMAAKWKKYTREELESDDPYSKMTYKDFLDYQERIRQEITEEAEAERRAGQTE